MSTHPFLRWVSWASTWCVLIQGLFAATPPFTYQGRLSDGGLPANGTYDIRFTLLDASSGGVQIGDAIVAEDIPVTLGLFHVELDFGIGAFLGEDRWMEIAVRPGESVGEYTILTPLQRICPVPYALFALDGNPGPMGPAGPQGVPGEAGPAGISISWQGSLSDAPSDPILNQAYYNTADGVAYVFDGLAWQLLAQDGATGPQGLQGETGLTGLTGPIGPTGPQGVQGPIGPVGPEGPPGSLDAWALTGSVGTDPLFNFLGTADEQPLEFRVNSHLALRIEDDLSGPLVGVNTSAPQATLHVNGNTLVEGDLTVSGAFSMGTLSFECVTINTDTPKPDYELSVDGQIVCEELLVQDSGDWPDYVFADSYRLRPLDEVESHIKSQRCLPGIPAATEVGDEGISVGAMQKRMMEKIEELTLYAIEQNKRLAQQESRIRVLEGCRCQGAEP